SECAVHHPTPFHARHGDSIIPVRNGPRAGIMARCRLERIGAMRSQLATCAVIALMSVAVAGQESHQRISLWPNGAPGSEARKGEPEQAQDYWVKSVHDPSITVYLPPPEKA